MPEEYAKHAFLGRVRKALESLPEIKAYYESPDGFKAPFFPATAAIQF